MKKLNINEMPEEIPVFPLSSTIFFPKTVLPLNIFEPRYKQMVEHAIKKQGLIGMIQAKQIEEEKNKISLFNIAVSYTHLTLPTKRIV